jgi:preprotein translocase subunit SecY
MKASLLLFLFLLFITSFFVLLLEEGIQKYGVGKSHQVRVILDRGKSISQSICLLVTQLVYICIT